MIEWSLLPKDKERLALRNNFRVTKKFLIAKFDCIIIYYLIVAIWKALIVCLPNLNCICFSALDLKRSSFRKLDSLVTPCSALLLDAQSLVN